MAKQKEPKPGKEFTLTEIRAANGAREQLVNDLWETMPPEARVGETVGLLNRIPEALSIDEPTDALLVQRLFVNAFLALDLAAQSAGVNLNESTPIIFNEESQKRKLPVELEYE